MRKLEDPMLEDFRRNVWTYEFHDGRRLKIDRDAVRKYGAVNLARSAGVEPFPKGQGCQMLPVKQGERIVGYVPETFDPDCAQSSTFMYDVRPGDFKRDNEGWVADRSLGPGDLDAVTEFRRFREALRKSPPQGGEG